MANVSKLILAIMFLVFFWVGVACASRPDGFMNAFSRWGGEEWVGWNRLGTRIVGAIFAGAALYMLYHLLFG
jgi:threonine/homoserine/homoserine lactone efflux protein